MKQIGFLILLVLLTAPVFAQSTNERFPTPILQNEVSGKIAARDVGDARLTRYFYIFAAENGDVNLEIETLNFDGDIDLFESETLRPLAKITIAAEGGTTKTNRQIYFRKRAQIVLRIEGRTLIDDAAIYRIAFSGSFVAATDLPSSPADDEPKVAVKQSPDLVAKVNSVGTIIEVLPPKKLEEISAPSTEPEIKPVKEPTAVRRTSRRAGAVKPKPIPTKNETAQSIAKAKTEISAEKSSEKPLAKTPKPKIKMPVKTPRSSEVLTARKTPAKKGVNNTDESISPQPDPLSNIQLVILLKAGDRIERPMSEIFNVSVDKGLITVITKTGKIARYNLLDVQKMTIE